MIFIDNKYTRWYYAIVERAQERASSRKQGKKLLGYVEQHHVIPECFFIERHRKGPKGWLPGDPNDQNNLVFLTGREHFICHLLLIRMTTGRAFHLMSQAFCHLSLIQNDRQLRYPPKSHWYELAKRMTGKNTTDRLKGKPRSAEVKNKISQAKKGKTFSEEHKKKLAEARKGKPPANKGKPGIKGRIVSEETRKKIGLHHKGKTVSEETRDKLSKANRGYKHTDAAKEKISKVSSNVSAETKAKRVLTRRMNKIKKLLQEVQSNDL